MTPTLGIVIPCFQSAPTIGRALNSIAGSIHQSRINGAHLKIEVALALDGPDQPLLDLLGELALPFPISVETTPARRGIASARNSGVRLLETELITFLDADDEITPHRIDAARKHQPGQVIIGGQQITRDSPKGSAGAKNPEPIDLGEHQLSSMIIRREDFWAVGALDERFSLGDDWDFVIRAKTYGLDIVQWPTPFVVRHLTGRNASGDHQGVKSDYMKAVRKHLRKASPND